MTARFRWGAVTDVGRVREINQDAVHAEDGLFIVADGMGGHRGGEVASAVAIESMTDGGQAPTTLDQLLGRVHEANAAIIERAAGDVELAGMGTTICAVAMLRDPGETQPSRLGIVNVGDSRVYRFADDQLVQVTEDHSLVETLVREGRITPDEARSHPQRNILTRALGIGHDLQVDYWELPIHLGDVYLLCSDGLFNEVSDDEIAATIRRLDDPSQVVDELVRMANEGGSRDNVSVVVAAVGVGADEKAPPIPRPASSAPETAEYPMVEPRFAYATDEPHFGDAPNAAPAANAAPAPGAAAPAAAASPPPPPAPAPTTAPSPGAPAQPPGDAVAPPPTASSDGHLPAPDAAAPPMGGADESRSSEPITPPRGNPVVRPPVPAASRRRPWWKFWGD
ncbi:MAG: Stp1/IreP family PP2C-type Ser/Thr phosphatase [Acidimicrobiales bacterium]